MRDGELGLSFVHSVENLKLAKLIQSNPSSSSSIIREQDLNLALLRASVGTMSASNPFLEHLRFVLDKGPLRPLLPSLSSSRSHHPLHQEDGDEHDRSKSSTSHSLPPPSTSSLFSAHLLGTPLRLTSTISWPLDLFLTPPALSAYTNIFAFLSALRKTHSRVKQTWTSLSGAQRSRRKWTKTGEGGLEEEDERKKLARGGWAIVRSMLWFLDCVLAHFQVRIIWTGESGVFFPLPSSF